MIKSDLIVLEEELLKLSIYLSILQLLAPLEYKS